MGSLFPKEPAFDPFLPEARREARARVHPHPPHRRAAPPARARPLSLLGGGLRPPSEASPPRTDCAGKAGARTKPVTRAWSGSVCPGRRRSGAVTLRGPSGSWETRGAVDLDHAPVGGVVGVADADARHGGEVRAEVVAVPPADRFDVPLVLVGVEHVDRELDHIGELAAGGGGEGAEVLARLAELGNQVALAHDAPVLVLRELTGEEQEATAACLDAVGVADGLRERGWVVELDLPRHGFLPSRTIVCPLVASSSSRFRTAAATSAGSTSRPPGLIRAMARTASSNDFPVFAAMLRAAFQTRSVPA